MHHSTSPMFWKLLVVFCIVAGVVVGVWTTETDKIVEKVHQAEEAGASAPSSCPRDPEQAQGRPGQNPATPQPGDTTEAPCETLAPPTPAAEKPGNEGAAETSGDESNHRPAAQKPTESSPAEKQDRSVPQQADKPDVNEAHQKADEHPGQKPAVKPDESAAQKAPGQKAADNTVNQSEDSYVKSAITNKADFLIREELDKADDLVDEDKFEDAIAVYDSILKEHPESPRAMIGRARALEELAVEQKSDYILKQSAKEYDRFMRESKDAPAELVVKAGLQLVHIQEFLGQGSASLKTLKFLKEKFPEDIGVKKNLGAIYMKIDREDEAKYVFQEILAKRPNDGLAQCYLGFIIKREDNDYETAARLLQAGIDSQENGTQHKRFYTQLGDAYHKLGRYEESRRVFQRGADLGLYPSVDQRSPHNVANLTARMWWTVEQSGYKEELQMLEDNWLTIRDEGVSQLDPVSGSFKRESVHLVDTGDWKQLIMYHVGRRNNKVCAKVPKTCALIDKFAKKAISGRGQAKFSVMGPGIHVWPHCGPTNSRIRAHLGLVVPEGPRVRVVNETRTWTEGKFIIFDDSFEHEVWHDGDSFRLVLIVDLWHPDLTEEQKESIRIKDAVRAWKKMSFHP